MLNLSAPGLGLRISFSGGQCHLIYLTILRSFSFTSLAYNSMCTFLHVFMRDSCSTNAISRAMETINTLCPVQLSILQQYTHTHKYISEGNFVKGSSPSSPSPIIRHGCQTSRLVRFIDSWLIVFCIVKIQFG